MFFISLVTITGGASCGPEAAVVVLVESRVFLRETAKQQQREKQYHKNTPSPIPSAQSLRADTR
jgi:hypothetical protein